MSLADEALRQQALPIVASISKVLQLPTDAIFNTRFSCLRGPYIAHYSDSTLSKLLAYTVLRPTTHAARIDRLAQAAEGVPPQPAVLKIWVPAVAAGGAATVADSPTYMAVDTVPELLKWLVAIDGVCRVMRGDYVLPLPPTAVPAFTFCGRSHDSVSLSWAPVAVHRPAERVQAFAVEFWRMRHGDVVVLPDRAADLHSLIVPNPWQPLTGSESAAGLIATPSSGTAHLAGLLEDARIPGLSGGDITRCTVIGLRPRAKYAIRVRALNAAGAGLAGGESGYAAAVAAATARQSSHGGGGSSTAPMSDGIILATTLGAPSVSLPAPMLCQPQTDHLVAVWPAPVLPEHDAPCAGFVLHVFDAAATDAVESATSRAIAWAEQADAAEDATADASATVAVAGRAPSRPAPCDPLPLWPAAKLGPAPGFTIPVNDPACTRVTVGGLVPGVLYTARVVILSRAGPGAWSLLSPPVYTLGPLTVTPLAPTLVVHQSAAPTSGGGAVASPSRGRMEGLLLRASGRAALDTAVAAAAAARAAPEADPVIADLQVSVLAALQRSAAASAPSAATSANVSWHSVSLGDHDAPILGYQLILESVRGQGQGHRSAAIHGPDGGEDSSCVLDAGQRLQATLTHMCPDTHFTVRVRAYSSLGPGPLSQPLVGVRTLSRPSIASHPPSADQGSATVSSMRVSWGEAELAEHDAPTVSYLLLWRSSGSTGTAAGSSSGGSSSTASAGSASKKWSGHSLIPVSQWEASLSSCAVEGLQADTAYVFGVAAVNEVGVGPVSVQSAPVRTLGRPSFAAAGVSPARAATAVGGTGSIGARRYATHNSLSVAWARPASGPLDAPLLSFQVEVRRKPPPSTGGAGGGGGSRRSSDDDSASAEFASVVPLESLVTSTIAAAAGGSEFSWVITGLVPGVQWEVRVAAMNAAGVGPFSRWSTEGLWTLGAPLAVGPRPRLLQLRNGATTAAATVSPAAVLKDGETSSVGQTTLAIEWDTVKDGEGTAAGAEFHDAPYVGYEIVVYTAGDDAALEAAAGGGGSLSHVALRAAVPGGSAAGRCLVTGLLPGRSHSFALRLVNSLGAGPVAPPAASPLALRTLGAPSRRLPAAQCAIAPAREIAALLLLQYLRAPSSASASLSSAAAFLRTAGCAITGSSNTSDATRGKQLLSRLVGSDALAAIDAAAAGGGASGATVPRLAFDAVSRINASSSLVTWADDIPVLSGGLIDAPTRGYRIELRCSVPRTAVAGASAASLFIDAPLLSCDTWPVHPMPQQLQQQPPVLLRGLTMLAANSTDSSLTNTQYIAALPGTASLDLAAGADYTVDIHPVNDVGVGSGFDAASAQTQPQASLVLKAPSVPLLPPSAVSLLQRSCRALLVSWSWREEGGGGGADVACFEAQWCRANDVLGSTGSNSNPATIIGTLRVPVRANDVCINAATAAPPLPSLVAAAGAHGSIGVELRGFAILSGLAPGGSYVARVRACSSIGAGAWGPWGLSMATIPPIEGVAALISSQRGASECSVSRLTLQVVSEATTATSASPAAVLRCAWSVPGLVADVAIAAATAAGGAADDNAAPLLLRGLLQRAQVAEAALPGVAAALGGGHWNCLLDGYVLSFTPVGRSQAAIDAAKEVEAAAQAMATAAAEAAAAAAAAVLGPDGLPLAAAASVVPAAAAPRILPHPPPAPLHLRFHTQLDTPECTLQVALVEPGASSSAADTWVDVVATSIASGSPLVVPVTLAPGTKYHVQARLYNQAGLGPLMDPTSAGGAVSEAEVETPLLKTSATAAVPVGTGAAGGAAQSPAVLAFQAALLLQLAALAAPNVERLFRPIALHWGDKDVPADRLPPFPRTVYPTRFVAGPIRVLPLPSCVTSDPAKDDIAVIAAIRDAIPTPAYADAPAVSGFSAAVAANPSAVVGSPSASLSTVNSVVAQRTTPVVAVAVSSSPAAPLQLQQQQQPVISTQSTRTLLSFAPIPAGAAAAQPVPPKVTPSSSSSASASRGGNPFGPPAASAPLASPATSVGVASSRPVPSAVGGASTPDPTAVLLTGRGGLPSVPSSTVGFASDESRKGHASASVATVSPGSSSSGASPQQSQAAAPAAVAATPGNPFGPGGGSPSKPPLSAPLPRARNPFDPPSAPAPAPAAASAPAPAPAPVQASATPSPGSRPRQPSINVLGPNNFAFNGAAAAPNSRQTRAASGAGGNPFESSGGGVHIVGAGNPFESSAPAPAPQASASQHAGNPFESVPAAAAASASAPTNPFGGGPSQAPVPSAAVKAGAGNPFEAARASSSAGSASSGIAPTNHSSRPTPPVATAPAPAPAVTSTSSDALSSPTAVRAAIASASVKQLKSLIAVRAAALGMSNNDPLLAGLAEKSDLKRAALQLWGLSESVETGGGAQEEGPSVAQPQLRAQSVAAAPEPSPPSPPPREMACPVCGGCLPLVDAQGVSISMPKFCRLCGAPVASSLAARGAVGGHAAV